MLSDVIKKYEGKLIDWDDVAGPQCVDLAKVWIQDLGIKTKGKGTSPWGNAKDYWISTPSVLFTRFGKIPYSSDDFQFIRGDLVIWGNGKYGHIAIATGQQDDSTFYTYDQNYGKDKTVRKVCHNRSSSILGVLRPYRKVLWDVNIRTKPSMAGAIIGEKKKGQQLLPLWLDDDKKWCRIGKGAYISYKSLEVL